MTFIKYLQTIITLLALSMLQLIFNDYTVFASWLKAYNFPLRAPLGCPCGVAARPSLEPGVRQHNAREALLHGSHKIAEELQYIYWSYFSIK